jgi:ribosomal protein S27E
MVIKNIHEIKECPECASSNIVYNDKKQQIICQDCGLIYEPLTPTEEKNLEKVSGIIKKTIKRLSRIKKKKKK